MTRNETVIDLQNKIQAVERAHRRTGKLLSELHGAMLVAVKEHGPDMGVSPNVVVPKEPNDD